MTEIEEKTEAIAPQDAMTIKQIADDAGVHEVTVRRWIERERNPLPSYKLGGARLVRREAYKAWVEGAGA